MLIFFFGGGVGGGGMWGLVRGTSLIWIFLSHMGI